LNVEWEKNCSLNLSKNHLKSKARFQATFQKTPIHSPGTPTEAFPTPKKTSTALAQKGEARIFVFKRWRGFANVLRHSRARGGAAVAISSTRVSAEPAWRSEHGAWKFSPRHAPRALQGLFQLGL